MNTYVHLYSAYEDPLNPQKHQFSDASNDQLINIIKNYTENQIRITKQQSTITNQKVRENLSATFTHAYVKRATALYQNFNRFCELVINKRSKDLYEKLNQPGYFTKLSEADRLAIGFESFLRWYRDDISIFYDAVKNAGSIRKMSEYELSATPRGSLKVLILKNLANAMATSAFGAVELQEAYYHVLSLTRSIGYIGKI